MGKKILIVDDAREIRELLKAALEEEYEVTSCKNGKEGWRSIKDSQFHLVITDWEMPKMNGLELTERIKASFPQTPVILTSGIVPEEHPADAFLQKPWDLQELLELIKNLL